MESVTTPTSFFESYMSVPEEYAQRFLTNLSNESSKNLILDVTSNDKKLMELMGATTKVGNILKWLSISIMGIQQEYSSLVTAGTFQNYKTKPPFTISDIHKEKGSIEDASEYARDNYLRIKAFFMIVKKAAEIGAKKYNNLSNLSEMYSRFCSYVVCSGHIHSGTAPDSVSVNRFLRSVFALSIDDMSNYVCPAFSSGMNNFQIAPALKFIKGIHKKNKEVLFTPKFKGVAPVFLNGMSDDVLNASYASSDDMVSAVKESTKRDVVSLQALIPPLTSILYRITKMVLKDLCFVPETANYSPCKATISVTGKRRDSILINSAMKGRDGMEAPFYLSKLFLRFTRSLNRKLVEAKSPIRVAIRVVPEHVFDTRDEEAVNRVEKNIRRGLGITGNSKVTEDTLKRVQFSSSEAKTVPFYAIDSCGRIREEFKGKIFYNVQVSPFIMEDAYSIKERVTSEKLEEALSQVSGTMRDFAKESEFPLPIPIETGGRRRRTSYEDTIERDSDVSDDMKEKLLSELELVFSHKMLADSTATPLRINSIKDIGEGNIPNVVERTTEGGVWSASRLLPNSAVSDFMFTLENASDRRGNITHSLDLGYWLRMFITTHAVLNLIGDVRTLVNTLVRRSFRE